jgi:hypothetical protein
MGVEMVDIYVGPKKEHFRVHKDKLCKIDYFHKMFDGGFAEASSNSATFPGDHCEAFDVLLGWAYHGTLRDLATVKVEKFLHHASWCVVEAYALAEKLYLPQLQDLIMSAALDCYEKMEVLPDEASIQLAYRKTSEKSPLRKLMVHVFSYAIQHGDSEIRPISSLQELLKKNDDLNTDFLTMLRKSPNAPCPTTLKKCVFHCHCETEPCVGDVGSKNK